MIMTAIIHVMMNIGLIRKVAFWMVICMNKIGVARIQVVELMSLFGLIILRMFIVRQIL